MIKFLFKTCMATVMGVLVLYGGHSSLKRWKGRSFSVDEELMHAQSVAMESVGYVREYIDRYRKQFEFPESVTTQAVPNSIKVDASDHDAKKSSSDASSSSNGSGSATSNPESESRVTENPTTNFPRIRFKSIVNSISQTGRELEKKTP